MVNFHRPIWLRSSPMTCSCIIEYDHCHTLLLEEKPFLPFAIIHADV